MSASSHIKSNFNRWLQNPRLHLSGGKAQRKFYCDNAPHDFHFFFKRERLDFATANTPEVRVFNFYFSLRHGHFHEQAILVYCFQDVIKNTTRCLVFCFTARFTRTKIKPFTVFLVFCLPHRRNITSVITLV